MQTTRSIRLVALVLALLLAGAASASAKTVKYTVPKLTGLTLKQAETRLKADHLKVGKITDPKGSKGKTLIVSLQAPKAGRREKKGSKVALRFEVKPVKAKPTTATLTTPTVTTVRADIDPSYTLPATPQAPPVPVTFTYSASTEGSMPDGELTLNIYVPGVLSNAGECEADIGGGTTSATCTVTLPAWGNYELITSYSSGVGDVAATGETDVVDVEPPAPIPATSTQSVTGSWPADQPTVSATITGSTAAVTLADPASFEGATSVTLTDNLGDTCQASITGTTATCSMAVTGTPSSFTVGYPGATTTSTSTSSAPDGWDDGQSIVTTTTTTTTWSASTYPVPAGDTTITVTPPPVTITWNNCYYQTGVACSLAGPVSIPAGDYINVGAVGIGDLDPSTQAPGEMDFIVTPMTGVTMTDDTGVTDSPDCDAMSSEPGGAFGDCRILFADPGTYTVQADYLSSDLSEYPDETGPVITVNVS